MTVWLQVYTTTANNNKCPSSFHDGWKAHSQVEKITMQKTIRHVINHRPGGGGELPYERGGDGRRKFWIKPLKETNLGVVAQPFFDP